MMICFFFLAHPRKAGDNVDNVRGHRISHDNQIDFDLIHSLYSAIHLICCFYIWFVSLLALEVMRKLKLLEWRMDGFDFSFIREITRRKRRANNSLGS